MSITHPFVSPQAESADPNVASKAEWQAPHVGVIGCNVLTKTGAYTIVAADLVGLGLLMILDCTGGAFTATLPLANTVPAGTLIRFKQHGINTCTISRQGSDTIFASGGAVSTIMFDGGGSDDGDIRSVVSDGGASWESWDD